MVSEPTQPPQAIADFAEQAAQYVRRSLNLELEYDSETMPLLDHYLREASGGRPETLALVAAAAGAYFGEVVRRLVGGTWQLGTSEPENWRLVLPGGLTLSPVGVALATLTRDESFDKGFDAPPLMLPHVEDALARMGQVTEDEYFSLCGRLDTVEHIHAVILAVATAELEKRESAPKN